MTVPNRKKVAIWTDFLFFGIPEWGDPEMEDRRMGRSRNGYMGQIVPRRTSANITRALSFVFLGPAPLCALTSYSYSEVSMISRLSTLMQASLPSSSMYQQ